ncbi:four-helix bundle copper-binding protein [Gimesia sp.]|uniref:four-helix bundle copper-binding protein n=1 Tax=Gimesia sp. TaxID=2024833 RepID=UPI000C37CCAB|nr:four-helix bundle copper-binding protein [Gimesia sp.]MAX40329.1 four-helix bundle copper-binding protein [Gimesia sp.]HAH48364.1 four-helix bundle copper-binding protein [Planctomycetaceae bacterium]HBL43753.1 four-helix bundle copper-binding protein [Planctomycetaceae bacterium]
MSLKQSCIDACLKCATDCEFCLDAMINKESHNDCPHCCRECVDICLYTAQALARNSKYSSQISQLCAEICTWCAEQCEAHEHYHCQACAASCRKCAAECKEVVAV